MIAKENKGITLIALVVSIIVLIILAGISISMLTGENSILKQAQKATKETNDMSTKEKFDLLSANYKIEKAVDNNLTFKEFCEKIMK